MQIAGCAAAAMSFAGRAQAVDRFAQAVGDELASARPHTLPRSAADHFDAALVRVPNET